MINASNALMIGVFILPIDCKTAWVRVDNPYNIIVTANTASIAAEISRDAFWWKITCTQGRLSTPIPTAAGMEINIVTFTERDTLLFAPSRSPRAKSLEIPGISAVAIALASAIGILASFVAFAIALKSKDTAASVFCWIVREIIW